MNTFYIWLAISFIMTLLLLQKALPKSNESAITIGHFTVPLLFLLSLVLRIILAGRYKGFGADIACFSAWADRMVTVGPSHFYSKDFFSDYPPLYLYLLYGIGFLKKVLSLEPYSPVHLVLLKLPAILSDLCIGYHLYRTCNKLVGLRSSICLTSIYLFQPVVLLNSCLWGQMDSLYVFVLLLVCHFLECQNLLPAMLLFGLGVLLKPQILIFTPILILGVIQFVFRGSFSLRMLMKACSYGLLTIIAMLLLAFPFGLDQVSSQYLDTLNSYPYASVNAYNFWAGVGLNWHPQTTVFMSMEAKTWGFVFIVLAASLSIVLGLRLGNLHQKHAVMGAFLIITMFTYSVRMHERYLFPAIPLLILSYAGFCSRQLCNAPGSADAEPTRLLTPTLRYVFPLFFTLLTWLHFFNCGHVLYYYDPQKFDADAPAMKLSGIAMTLCSLFFYYIVLRLLSQKEHALGRQGSHISVSHSPIKISHRESKMTRLDFLWLTLILVLYSCFALRDLGSMRAPESIFTMKKGQTVTFSFPEGQSASSMSYYIAPEHNRTFSLSLLPAQTGSWSSSAISLSNVFTWQTVEFDQEAVSVSMTAQTDASNLIELVFLDASGKQILPIDHAKYPELFDEQDTFPERISFRNGMYFDEIYHARTAYEYLHGLRSYENTHPPLGKVLISIGILLFGMNPFGWRIIGTLFGIVMLPMLYLFAKRLTADTACSAITCWIFAFDFMHFTQTRIATIDVYIVFFILCMYYFLYYFFTLDYGTVPLRHLCLPLGLCGISMGLGIACKWTGVYAGAGMGLLFFGYIYSLYGKQLRYKNAKKAKDGQMAFLQKTKKLILFCIPFFVVIPTAIYFSSYFLFCDNSGHTMLQQALDNQKTMYQYHSQLNATHYFASPFYEWPFIVRPIWYYSGVLSSSLREGISSFGNPLVWWAGIPAFGYMIYLVLRKKDRRALFLIVSYLAQYLPWFFVKRLTFIYHYFPCVIFLVLMIGYAFRNLQELLPKKGFQAILILYGIFVFGLFLLFYPVLAGQPVDVAFAERFLKWFKTWVLIAK